MDGYPFTRTLVIQRKDSSAIQEANDNLALQWWHEIKCVGTRPAFLLTLHDRVQATGPHNGIAD